MRYRIRMSIAFLGALIVFALVLAGFALKIQETVDAGDWSFVTVCLIAAVMILQAENISAPTGDRRHAQVRWWHRQRGRLGLD